MARSEMSECDYRPHKGRRKRPLPSATPPPPLRGAALQALDDVFEPACFSRMLISHARHFLLELDLHLLHTILHVQDSFNPRQIDTQVPHQAANMYNSFDVAIRIKTWAVWTIALARWLDQPQALIVA